MLAEVTVVLVYMSNKDSENQFKNCHKMLFRARQKIDAGYFHEVCVTVLLQHTRQERVINCLFHRFKPFAPVMCHMEHVQNLSKKTYGTHAKIGLTIFVICRKHILVLSPTNLINLIQGVQFSDLTYLEQNIARKKKVPFELCHNYFIVLE